LRLSPDGADSVKQVVVLHGLGSCKENHLVTLYRLASSGFDAFAIDLFLHGERPESPELAWRLDWDIAAALQDIIGESADDIPEVCAEMGIDISRAGILGISCGGFVAHALAVRRPQFAAMVAAISSPDWMTIDESLAPDPLSALGMQIARTSPINHGEDYPPLPVLMLNNDGDRVVSGIGSRRLFEMLKPKYAEIGIEHRLRLKVYDSTEHFFSTEMMAEAVDWFRAHL
jgi:dienelactone hydrolase